MHVSGKAGRILFVLFLSGIDEKGRGDTGRPETYGGRAPKIFCRQLVTDKDEKIISWSLFFCAKKGKKSGIQCSLQ